MNIVYSYYVSDIVHKGHLEMMKNSKAIAGENGKLIVGILTDEAVMEKKAKPVLSFEQRIDLAGAIKYVDVVVAQETYSPLPNIMRIKPDILMESSRRKRMPLFLVSMKGFFMVTGSLRQYALIMAGHS